MIKKNIFFIFILIILSALFLTSIWPSGLKYSFGYGFWNAHGHDAIWHLAVANQSLKSIPPPNPVFSGHRLTGYHWGYDFILGLVHFITKIPTLTLYFQILPLVITFSFVFLSFCLKKFNKVSTFFFIFLNFFAGSFGYLVTLIKYGQLGGESLFWSMQSISTLINPPYALSLVILTLALVLYQKNMSRPTIKRSILIGFLFGLNTIIKIYASVISGLAILVLLVYAFFGKSKKNLKPLFITFLSAGITSLVFLLIIGISSSPSLIFKPFWFVNSLIDAYDKLYLPAISALRFNIENQLSFIKIPILLAIYLLSLTLFIIGNLGTRIFGLFIVFSKKKPSQLDLFFFVALFISFVLPLLFIQSGTPWNTIQFFYYFLFIANFYTADYLANLYTSKKFLFLIIIILATIPTSLATFRSFIGFPPPASLPTAEITALEFLRQQPEGVVLTQPYDSYASKPQTPIPLYLYQTSAYVSAFSHKISFLEDYMNLDITNYDWQNRKQQVDYFFSNPSSSETIGFLLNNQIDYIYLVNYYLPTNLANHTVSLIYDQAGIKIYKVLK